ncbi:GPI biosynthesis protein family Pig-F-domain-containing protein [Podospora didyma]|uniref:GPI biosynthesis protein family Pig-F-domain-containing protein n=1 Tax=Podospora didyma TaxID=330526 RepID=A0AAE0KKR9_9PEZI|nr:GPI biosynthesis protein family Pig-F-domain-containing protein [Podospora didyma]
MPLVDPVTMSSTSIIKSVPDQPQSQSKSKDGAAPAITLQPIYTKQTALAQSTRHAFPALLAVLFIVRFNSLVEDPVSIMATSLPLVAILQMGYVLICLPVAGSHHPSGRTAAAARKPRPGEKKKFAGGDGSEAKSLPAALLSLILTTLITPFLFVAMVLFGAPMLTHSSHTFLCAAHLALLALFPLFFARGVDAAAWAAVGSFQAPFDETFGGLVGGLVGAWLGAVPIPLDWDREWQKWPVTILCGLYAGYLVGRAIGGSLAFGTKF